MKSAGPEGIPLKFIKLTNVIITPVLVEIFNKCIVNGVYPYSLKIGQIFPIHKSGPKNLCNNYRPSSLLSSVVVETTCFETETKTETG